MRRGFAGAVLGLVCSCNTPSTPAGGDRSRTPRGSAESPRRIETEILFVAFGTLGPRAIGAGPSVQGTWARGIARMLSVELNRRSHRRISRALLTLARRETGPAFVVPQAFLPPSDAAEWAREFGAHRAVQGLTRVDPSGARIQLRIVDAAGTALVDRTFDRPRTELPELLDQSLDLLVEALGLPAPPSGQGPPTPPVWRQTRRPEPLDLFVTYLDQRVYEREGGALGPGAAPAIELLEHAVSAEPTFAAAVDAVERERRGAPGYEPAIVAEVRPPQPQMP